MAIDPSHLVALPPRVTRHVLDRRSTILYALGIGAGQAEDELQFVYEDGLQALPTMPVVMAYPGFWQREPEYGIDWKRLLHGEQSVVLHRAIPVEGEVRGEMTIDKIVDKGAGKGALLYSSRRIFDVADDALIATVSQVSFLRGDGGCGSTGEPSPPPPVVPETEPDLTLAVATRPEQALIYRLSGDLNPLHVDPAVAREGGFERPILHGLCTFGFAGRALVRLLCDNDAARLRRMDCRFTSPVYPGETLDVSVWVGSQGTATFRVVARERGVTVLNNGYTEYQES